ncbi:MAG TPA: class I SAM-dependent methyltransferase [Bryobacteraceae bacterium]|nr:class I SAM-dependent methyltransferase [Bryobacteraceae bacterium]
MLVSALEGHRLWAENYDTTPNPLLALERRLLDDLLDTAAGTCVVDVACGTGRWTKWFSERGARAFGFDVCAEMLGRVPSGLRGRCARARAENLPIASHIADLTVCSFAAGYFPALEQAIREMARITAIGGRVVIADLHPATGAAGWTRSFRAAGRVYEIEHFRYSVADFTSSAERAGLHLTSEIHGCFGEPERPIFEMAERPERFAHVTDVPAIWIGDWRKT